MFMLYVEAVTNATDKKLSSITPWTIEQVNKKETDGRWVALVNVRQKRKKICINSLFIYRPI